MIGVAATTVGAISVHLDIWQGRLTRDYVWTKTLQRWIEKRSSQK